MAPGRRRPGQESLIAVSSKSNYLSPRDFAAEEVLAVPLIERNIHLINCLNAFMHSARPTAELNQQAKESFARAFGHYVMLDAEVRGPLWVKALTRGYFHAFSNKYAGLDNYQAAWRYRQQLSEQIELLQTSPPEHLQP